MRHPEDSLHKLLADDCPVEDLYPPSSGSKRAVFTVSAAAWWSIVVVQAVIISILLLRGNMSISLPKALYLYSPAEGAISYEIRSFRFSIGGDVPPFQRPPSPELDAMWQDLYSFGLSSIPKDDARKLPNKTSAIPGDPENRYMVQLEVFHQLHCLNMVRQALYPDYYPNMRLGSPHADQHVLHCIDAIRQSMMCTSDISTTVWQWDETLQRTNFQGEVAHTCRNFGMIQDWAKKRSLDRHYEDKIRMQDDINIPIYRSDGSSYFT